MGCGAGALSQTVGVQDGILGGTGVMLPGDVSSLLFPALEAAGVDVCGSVETLFS